MLNINSNKNKYNELFDNYVNLFTAKNKSIKTEIDIINNSLNEKNLLYNQGIEKLNYFAWGIGAKYQSTADSPTA